MREYQATYLPEVAPEQKWDKLTAIRSLVHKAGFRKAPEQVLDQIRLTTYESSKAKLTFLEYEKFKQEHK